MRSNRDRVTSLQQSGKTLPYYIKNGYYLHYNMLTNE